MKWRFRVNCRLNPFVRRLQLLAAIDKTVESEQDCPHVSSTLFSREIRSQLERGGINVQSSETLSANYLFCLPARN